MANILSAPTTLVAAVWAEDKTNAMMRNVILAVAGSLLLWLCAKIQIPFYPVPLTLTTFGVLIIGAAYGWRLGMVTVALYLAEGAAGLPVFAGTPEKGIGLVYMMGSTGGYLFGYLFAAGAAGWLAERGFDRNFFTTAVAMFVGNVVLYVPGLLWLGILFGWDKPIFEWGLTPFIFGDLTKLALAAVLLPGAWFIVKKIKGQD